MNENRPPQKLNRKPLNSLIAPLTRTALAILLGLNWLPPVSAQESLSGGAPQEINEAVEISFSFEKADWQDVIPWFAEQTGYSWQPISQFPEGSFTLSDNKRYTPLEALDQLNYALRLQDPPYTIIRNRNQLILTEASSELPVELIPHVTVAQLSERGDYELLSCEFGLGTLNAYDVELDLTLLVDEKYSQFSKLLPQSNGFYVRGTGANLKRIRDAISKMAAIKRRTYKTYNLKFYSPEQFLNVARNPLQIPEETFSRDDGTLAISIDAATNRLIINGTDAAHEDFLEVAAIIDVAPEKAESGQEHSFLRNYAVIADPEMTKKVVETMLDGTTATIGQNEVTGSIVLRGTEAQHKIAEDVISTIQGATGSTKIVELENASASDILTAVNSLLNITPTSAAANPNAPRLLANTTQNYIVIHGTPQEIFKISDIIAQLDQAQGRDPDQARTNARVIELSPKKRDEMLDSVEDYWPTTGRKNRLRIIMPDEKVQDKLKSEAPRFAPRNSSTDAKPTDTTRFSNVAFQQPEKTQNAAVESTVSSVAANVTQGPRYGALENGAPKNRLRIVMPDEKVQVKLENEARRFALRSAYTGAVSPDGARFTNVAFQQPEKTQNAAIESTVSSVRASAPQGTRYAPPQGKQSKPGADVSIKATPFGVLLQSDDLDALDDLEDIFRKQSQDDGIDQGLTIFYLKYRKAASVKSELDQMFGLESASPSSDAGGLVSGIVDNVAGGGTGDLLGGLLGGTTSSAPAGAIELTGEVQIGLSVPLNLLYVSGATASDLDYIQDAVDLFDQPSAPQNPELVGQSYAIPIRHRAPDSVFSHVSSLMADYISGGDIPEQQNDDQDDDLNQVARLVRGAGGGGGDGGGGGGGEETPSVRISLDKESSQILVIGPKFIYEQILELVEAIDTPDLSQPKTYEVLPAEYFSMGAMEIIKNAYGSKIAIIRTNSSPASNGESGQDSQTGDNAATGSSAPSSQRTSESRQRQQRAAQLFRSLRNRGGATGGGAQRGGGGRPGGGR